MSKIYVWDKAAKIHGSPIPNGSKVEVIKVLFNKMIKVVIRYDGQIYFTTLKCVQEKKEKKSLFDF